MNYLERVCKLVDLYVDQNGCDQEMTSEEFKQWVTQNGETSASPSDICFNRCNKGLGEFQYGHFCLVYNLLIFFCITLKSTRLIRMAIQL